MDSDLSIEITKINLAEEIVETDIYIHVYIYMYIYT
jgi:hypothetical protein